MKNYSLRTYKYLDAKFKSILMDKDASWRTYCISCLQFIKPHTEYFVKYDQMIEKNFLKFLSYLPFMVVNFILKIIKWQIRIMEDALLMFLNKKTKNYKQQYTDVVFVTCLVNTNTINSRKNLNKDFIFGTMIRDLRKLYNIKVIYINLTRKNSRLVFNEIKKNKDIIVLKKILSIKNELKILIDQIKEVKSLFSNLPAKKLKFKEFFLIIANVFSFETKDNFRLRSQLKIEIQKLQPKLSVVSFEGHCWEKVVFEICKNELNNNCKNIGYQHGGVIRNQKHINRTYKKNFNPDVILNSGKLNQKYFSKSHKSKKNELFEIGSNRFIYADKKYLYKKRKKKNKSCLILPEGTNFETKILFDFANELAEKFQDYKFILRTHPQINMRKFLKRFFFFDRYKKKDNLIFSKDSFPNDLNKCAYVLYRGSTGVIPAVLKGLLPIYFKLPNESINLDPIFELKKFKYNISTIDEFRSIINHRDNKIDEFKQALSFCGNYFTEQDTQKTQSIFKKLIK